MAQFGCPNARDLSGHSGPPGTGGPPPNSSYTVIGTGEVITRQENRGKGAIPDEHTAKISNAPGALPVRSQATRLSPCGRWLRPAPPFSHSHRHAEHG